MKKLLIVCGPTGTGKTALAVRLAKKLNGELISADSRQVYRGMDLTTGKDRSDVPIWLYDVADPSEEFSVSHWVKLARLAIEDIQKRKKLPIIVGGTGLYIKALLHPFETINVLPNRALRKKLQALSVGELQKMVSRGDMNQSDWNNPRRLIRKIEIQKSKTHVFKKKSSYDYLMIGLTASRSVLYKRIDDRMRERVKLGMHEEIERLMKKYGRDFPAMSAIGINERAYAKRQLTWFKKQKGIHWFDISQKGFEDGILTLLHE